MNRPVRSVVRITTAVLLAEAIPVLILIGVVFLLGPKSADGAAEFAGHLGDWIGPVGGACATLLLAYWAARASKHPLRTGLLVGALVAALDISLLIAAGAPFRWLFAASAVGRIVAGLAGGYWALAKRSGLKNQMSR